MKFPVSWIAVAGVLATVLLLGYARLHAQPPRMEQRAAPQPSLIITTNSESVLRKVKSAIKDIDGGQHYIVENRMANGKLTRFSTKIRIQDVTMIDRAVKNTIPQNTMVLAETAVFGGKSLARVRAALQGVDAKLFQARLVDAKALMSGKLVTRGALLPAVKPAVPNQAPKQGY
jgi:hypothetical protein